MIELIEVKKSKRGPLRFWGSGDPARKLIGVEVRQLPGGVTRQFPLLHLHLLGFNSLIADGQTTPARFPKKPEAIGWRLAFSVPPRGFADGGLKRLLRLACIARHQETKAVELREILGGDWHARIL